MKKKKIPLLIIAAVFVLTVILAVWYFTPTVFLSGVKPSDVKSISVFDGNTGKAFDISGTDEIRCIVENIQSAKMKKEKISIGYSGFCFRISFYGEAGQEIESFIINSDNTIRRDPFFYRCNGGLCFDYLEELEDKYAN